MLSCDFNKDLQNVFLSKVENGYFISKSYTKDVMAVCVSYDAKIGIDIEKKRERSAQTIAHFISKFKTFNIRDIPESPDLNWFYLAWTAMESYFKLEGMGFSTKRDFIMDLENKTIIKNGSEIAWFEYLDIDGLVICICSDRKFSINEVVLNYHGWEER